MSIVNVPVTRAVPKLSDSEIKKIRTLIQDKNTKENYKKLSSIEENQGKVSLIKILSKEKNLAKSDIMETFDWSKSTYSRIMSYMLNEHKSIMKYNESKKMLEWIGE